MRSTYREYFVTQHLTVTSNKDFYIDLTTKVKFVWHPDGYYIGIPHKLYNIEDYIPVPSNNSYNVSETDYIAPKLPTIGNTSPFTNGGKREYHTDISDSLNDLDISIGSRSNKPNYIKKEKASKEFKKNWISWSQDISLGHGDSLLTVLENKFRSFWDEILKDVPQDNIVLLVFRIKTSDGAIRFIHYLRFFPHKPKIFDRVYYLLEEKFTEKTEYIHTAEEQKLISGVIFQYQIIPVQKKVVKEENSDTSPKTDSTAIASPVLLSPIPLNVDSYPEEFIETNSHVSSDFNDYPDEDEEYPSPTPILPSNRSVNELDPDDQISPEVVQAISDQIEANIDEYINRDTERLQEELGDNVDLRVSVVYDDEDDSSNGPDSDTNMLCDVSYVYSFDLDLDELPYFVYFFM
jgi:hypothetical protein